MQTVATVGDLVSLAVQAERNAEALYDGMSKMFIRYPEVARFWAHYANEEAGHARWMLNLRNRICPDLLTRPADSELWSRAVKLVEPSVDDLLGGIHDLQDAWELANEMEHGETNLIFAFLIDNFTDDDLTLTFLRIQLREHMEHLLVGLPVQFGDANLRRAITPNP